MCTFTLTKGRIGRIRVIKSNFAMTLARQLLKTFKNCTCLFMVPLEWSTITWAVSTWMVSSLKWSKKQHMPRQGSTSAPRANISAAQARPRPFVEPGQRKKEHEILVNKFPCRPAAIQQWLRLALVDSNPVNQLFYICATPWTLQYFLNFNPPPISKWLSVDPARPDSRCGPSPPISVWPTTVDASIQFGHPPWGRTLRTSAKP